MGIFGFQVHSELDPNELVGILW